MKCKTCGQEVGMFGAIAHMMGMHGESKGQYKCKSCGASFDTKEKLAEHQKTHM